MSRNGIPNQLNASLIREVRMIAQQFFRSKENTTFWESRHQKPVQPQVPFLDCCFCADTKTQPSPAFTVINGYAVCPKHASYVRGDEYTSILGLIKRNENR